MTVGEGGLLISTESRGCLVVTRAIWEDVQLRDSHWRVVEGRICTCTYVPWPHEPGNFPESTLPQLFKCALIGNTHPRGS